MVALLAGLTCLTTFPVGVGIPDTNWKSKATVGERIESFMLKITAGPDSEMFFLSKIKGLYIALELYITLPLLYRWD